MILAGTTVRRRSADNRARRPIRPKFGPSCRRRSFGALAVTVGRRRVRRRRGASPRPRATAPPLSSPDDPRVSFGFGLPRRRQLPGRLQMGRRLSPMREGTNVVAPTADAGGADTGAEPRRPRHRPAPRVNSCSYTWQDPCRADPRTHSGSCSSSPTAGDTDVPEQRPTTSVVVALPRGRQGGDSRRRPRRPSRSASPSGRPAATRTRDNTNSAEPGHHPTGLASLADKDPISTPRMTQAETGRLLTHSNRLDPYPRHRPGARPQPAPAQRPRLPPGAPQDARSRPRRQKTHALSWSPRSSFPAPARGQSSRPDSLHSLLACPGSSFSVWTGSGGLLVGAMFYAMVLSVIEYGPEGPLLWLKAKFLDRVSGLLDASTSSTCGTTTTAKLWQWNRARCLAQIMGTSGT